MREDDEMTVQLTIEVESQQAAQLVLQALEAYKEQRRQSIARAERHLKTFEERSGVPTHLFIVEMTAGDLEATWTTLNGRVNSSY
jgi:hypothetical protein